MARNTNKINSNAVEFLDSVPTTTPSISSNYIDYARLKELKKGSSTEEKEFLEKCLDIVLYCNKNEKFLSYGELVAINTLKRLNVLG